MGHTAIMLHLTERVFCITLFLESVSSEKFNYAYAVLYLKEEFRYLFYQFVAVNVEVSN